MFLLMLGASSHLCASSVITTVGDFLGYCDAMQASVYHPSTRSLLDISKNNESISYIAGVINSYQDNIMTVVCGDKVAYGSASINLDAVGLVACKDLKRETKKYPSILSMTLYSQMIIPAYLTAYPPPKKCSKALSRVAPLLASLAK